MKLFIILFTISMFSNLWSGDIGLLNLTRDHQSFDRPINHPISLNTSHYMFLESPTLRRLANQARNEEINEIRLLLASIKQKTEIIDMFITAIESAVKAKQSPFTKTWMHSRAYFILGVGCLTGAALGTLGCIAINHFTQLLYMRPLRIFSK